MSRPVEIIEIDTIDILEEGLAPSYVGIMCVDCSGGKCPPPTEPSPPRDTL